MPDRTPYGLSLTVVDRSSRRLRLRRRIANAPIDLTDWFLRTGLFATGGKWLDAAKWASVWAWKTGRLNLNAFWRDTEAW